MALIAVLNAQLHPLLPFFVSDPSPFLLLFFLPSTIYLPPPTASPLLVFSPISLGNGDKLKAEMLLDSLTQSQLTGSLRCWCFPGGDELPRRCLGCAQGIYEGCSSEWRNICWLHAAL